MSGVGVSGLLANLPGTVTPYPVLDYSLGLGGFRTVNDVTARNAILPQFRQLNMEVTTVSDGNKWTLIGGLADANWQRVQGQAPFRGQYYVDPTFTGLQVGSQSNPFTTIAAAFTAALALGLSSAIVRLPPGVVITENVVLPATGGSWEIACDEGYTTNTLASGITGTVTATSTAALSAFRLSNIVVTGNISGDATGGTALFYFDSLRHIGTVSLTVTGANIWITQWRGKGPASANQLTGSTTGAVSVAGSYTAANWVFRANITEAPTTFGAFTPALFSTFRDCIIGNTSSVGTAITVALNSGALYAGFFDCYIFGPLTLSTTQTNYVVSMDGATLSLLTGSPGSPGLTLGGAGNIVLKTMNANASDVRTVTGNRGSTAYGARNPAGLFEIDYDMTLLAQGTLGLLQFNAIYTDSTGTLVTVPVGIPLDITGAVGSKQQGALRFQHNGASSPIAYSLTGITTAGAMSVAFATSLQRRN